MQPESNGHAPNFVTAAKQFTVHGFRVFPCWDKRPLTPNGLHDATTDDGRIEEWGSDNPNAQVGVRTGDGLVVIDIDKDKGGYESFKELEAKLGLPRPTANERTPGGGQHRYYRVPADATIKSRNGVAPGIDIKSDGGYVVGAGSPGPKGKRYEWNGHTPQDGIAELPVEAIRFFNAPAKGSAGRSADRFLDGVPLGQRDDAAYKFACKLRGDGVKRSTAERLILKAAAACNPPFPPDKALEKVARAYEEFEPNEPSKPRQSLATTLIQEFDSLYDVIRSGNEFFVADKEKPGLATRLSDFGPRLAGMHYTLTGDVPNTTAVNDAMRAIEGTAHDAAEGRVGLRILQVGDNNILIDRGEPSGSAIGLTAKGAKLLKSHRQVFVRTQLTGELVEPDFTGHFTRLWTHIPVAAADRYLQLGVLVSYLVLPHRPTPIVVYMGEAGSGKTSVALKVRQLIDPSPAGIQAPPRDPGQWVALAANQHLIVLDNVSGVPSWFADALCRTVTGDGWVVRKLYTDKQLAVFHFKRPIIMTTIDFGFLRGDLADRSLAIELERIPPERRLPDETVMGSFESDLPKLLGGLINLACEVLTALPQVLPPHLPRMADFATVLYAMDEVLGTNAFNAYMDRANLMAQKVVESDYLATAILQFIRRVKRWQGSAGELLQKLDRDAPYPLPHGWPKTPGALGGSLKTLAPALRSMGVEVEHLGPQGKYNVRTWRLEIRKEEQ